MLTPIESSIRGSGATLIFKDYVAQAIADAIFLFGFRAYKIARKLSEAVRIVMVQDIEEFFVIDMIIIAIVAGTVIYVARLLIGQRFFPTLLVVFTGAGELVTMAILIMIWSVTCSWQPLMGIVIAGAFAVAFYRLRNREPWHGRVLVAMLVTGAFGFAAANAWQAIAADTPPSVNIYPHPAYDAETNPNGQTVVLSRHEDAIFFDQGRQLPVPGSERPQRLAWNNDERAFFIANYLTNEIGAISMMREGGESGTFDIPRCNRPIDITVFYQIPRLILACERSNILLIRNYARPGAPDVFIELDGLIYHVDVDERRYFAYVTAQMGQVYRINLHRNHPSIGKERWLGPTIVWGVAVWSEDGSVWVTRPAPGEVMILDQDLNTLGRVTVGFGARDIEIDQELDVAYVANYITGTVDVIDLKTRKRTRSVWVGDRSLVQQVRGVSVTPDHSILISKSSGVWSVSP
ncbi:hypothetical protein K8I61_11705 [bacterium]|nr:hypothetical protein [bacterium]